MNGTKRSLLCILSLLLFAAVIMTSAVYAAENASVWQGGVSESLAGEGTETDPYLIATGDDLACFSKLVAAGDTFSGKYVKLVSDIDMGGAAFYPIGYDETASYVECDRAFSGTFDGNSNTISGIFQSTAQMKGVYNGTAYNAAMGLFGHLADATVRNLNVDSFEADGEYADAGCIAAYASGNCSFVNITVTNSKVNTLGAGASAIVGWDKGGHTAQAASRFTFANVTVDSTNVIGDKYACFAGGMLGYLGTYSTADFDNCHVAAAVTAVGSDYYGAGMLIGVVDRYTLTDGKRAVDTNGISTLDCTVYGTDTALAFGYGWGVDAVYAINGTTENDGTVISSATKFTAAERSYLTNTTVSLTDIFATVENTAVRAENTVVTASTASGTAYAVIGDDGTLTLGGIGTVRLTISDYYFCIPTSAVITVYEPDPVVKFNGTDKTILNGTALRAGDIFTAIDGAEIDLGNITVSVTTLEGDGVATIGNAEAWADRAITFSGVGKYQLTVTDNYYCIATTATVTVYEPTPVVKFETKLPNTDKYLYRVGNRTDVTLGTLFASTGEQITSSSVTVAIESSVNAGGTFTANTSDWTQGKIRFTNTGVVKVTITDNDYCIATELYLEVVNGKNITSAAGSIDGTNVVLLSNVKIASGGTANYINCTVYGNGFTFDVSGGMNKYESKQGHGIIITKNATLDNLVIVGDVYTGYGAYSTQDDYTSAVDATSSTIQNCYIANCAAPVRGNGVTIINTTLYGGTVANLILSGNVNTLTDVTTVNYNDGRGVIGLGIVINDGAADTTRIVLNGTLKQYNFICQSDIASVPSTEAQTIFNSMFTEQFSAFHINYNGTTYLNTGIVSMSPDFNSDDITDNTSTGYTAKDDVTLKLQAPLGAMQVEGAVYSTPASGAVDNGYVYADDTHVSNTQGDYLPTPEFDLGGQAISKDGDDDTRYLVGNINGIEALYQSGDAPLTLDLTSLMKVYKYNGVYYTVSAVCKDADGNVLTAANGVVTLSESGNYTLVFTVEDNVFYGPDGNAISKSVTRTYEVPLVLSVKEASIPDATITVSSADIAGEYISSGTDKKYQFYPMKAITSITDAGEDFNFKANISGTSVSYSVTDNAFGGTTTITVTYTTGQVLTITLGKPTDLNSPSASNGGKTLTVSTDSTNGIKVVSTGKIASGSAVDGTWPITGWSFKGTNQATVTNSTAASIKFTQPSGGSCVAADTLITLADGTQKRADELTGDELLLVWNLETGSYDIAPIVFVDNDPVEEYEIIHLFFSDGSDVKVIYEHGFFDIDLARYVYITADNYSEYIGHRFVTMGDIESGTWNVTVLESAVLETELTTAWSPVTAKHLCYYTNGVLSMPGGIAGLFNIFDVDTVAMCYDAEKMAADIEAYGLFDIEDYEGMITEDAFYVFNGDYLKVAIAKGMLTWEDIAYLAERYIPLM